MIEVQHLSKVFRIPHVRKKTLFHNVLSLATGRYDYEEFYALKDVSFRIQDGEFVGVIGRNGSGKSTLLKILSRIYLPTTGTVSLGGTIYPLLELGVGFQLDFSVRENLFIYGSFLGMSRKEMLARMDAILAFAELQRFVDARLDNLSSGMKVRLAFSIAMQADASIYLVDDILAVGDRWFQEKCRKEFRNLKSQKKTVLFVSHDQSAIEEFCDRVFVLSGGELAGEGSPQEMITSYNRQVGGIPGRNEKPRSVHG